MTTMAVQEPGMCSNFFQSVSDTASSVVNWCGRTAQTIGSTVGNYAQKAAEWAKPHFDKMKEFISENRGTIIVAVVAAAIGALVCAAVSAMFNSNSTSTEPATTPDPQVPGTSGT